MFAIAGVTAVLAGIGLLLFLQQYREDLTGSDPVQVVVARSLVPKGTPGEVIAGDRYYRMVEVQKSQLDEGAITDPAKLDGKVVKKDIYPGHQLSTSDFASSRRQIHARLSGYERAMSVPVDEAHGMIGKIQTGDRVDVIVTFQNGVGAVTAARVATRNALVLSLPQKPKTGGIRQSGQPATIRVRDDAATDIAAASDGGKVWLVLRPAIGAKSHDTTGRMLNSLRRGGTLGRIEIDVKGAK
jgi:pilus assembly protein CpaB